MTTAGQVHRISISTHKGDKKTNIPRAMLKIDYGIEGDAHAGSERQVSLLPIESFAKLDNSLINILPGDFAENITTQGVDFTGTEIGRMLCIGRSIRLRVTQIGKECHHGCIIRQTVGDCIMPREGIFARVIQGGTCEVGDPVWWEQP